MEYEEIKIERKCPEFEDFNKFKVIEKTFDKQYYNIYHRRLSALRSVLEHKAIQKWGFKTLCGVNFSSNILFYYDYGNQGLQTFFARKQFPLDHLSIIPTTYFENGAGRHQILQITNLAEFEDDTELVIIVGTIYKYQELKPSILKELSDELQLISQPSRRNFCSEKDQLFLEDDMLRVNLVGSNMNPNEVVTGIVCALLGFVRGDGTFWVEDNCMPGMCLKSSILSSPEGTKGKILLLSGLDLATNPDSMHYELLKEWIGGMAGNNDAMNDAASVILVIIAGNSIKGSTVTHHYKGYEKAKNKYKASILESTLATNRFDNLLEEIVSTCCVLLMPGEFDPTTFYIPQPPMHPCILPKSSRYKTFHGATNPWIGRIGDRIVSGSSGQPINDIMKVAELIDYSEIDWLEKTLTWRHFAPTAPDTLPCYPYFQSDPFIMQECPDIYFAGNMAEFSTKLIIGQEGQKVRLICIPKFSKTHTAVLVDLESLDTQLISFGVN